MKKILLILLATISLAHAGAGIGTVTTSATGATYVPLATSGVAQHVDMINNTGTAIEVRLGGSGSTFQIATGFGYVIHGIKTLSQVEVRRADTSNVQVTFSYVYSSTD